MRAWRSAETPTGSSSALFYGDQSAWFKTERATNPYFARLNFSSAQATMRRLDKAFRAFFRRVKAGEKPGYPRFKARERFNSIEFPSSGDGIRWNGTRLRFQHVGIVRVKNHRPVEGTIKTLTLKREAGKWFLILSCDLGAREVAQSTKPPVGIDLGIEAFLTTSAGEREPNPAFLKTALPALRRASRGVSRKKRGRANRKKAGRRVATLYVRVKHLRREHHLRVARRLVGRYGEIAVERLGVTTMLKNHRLARAIADAGWSQFVGVLKHKAEEAGASVTEVNAAGTSQECSGCGAVLEKALGERRHVCACGVSLHRDENAARNILARALRARTEPVGLNVGVC